jgi:hypothetical protein
MPLNKKGKVSKNFKSYTPHGRRRIKKAMIPRSKSVAILHVN